MTVVKGGHYCSELCQAVMHIRHRIDQMVGLTGQKVLTFEVWKTKKGICKPRMTFHDSAHVMTEQMIAS